MSGKIYTALGLMSGTSLDGVDAAIIHTDGERIFDVNTARTTRFSEGEPHRTQAFSARDRADLQHATRAALDWQFSGPMPNLLAQAEQAIDDNHIAIIDAMLRGQGKAFEGQMPTTIASAIDVIGYHGQTVLHRPATPTRKGETLQLGRGEILARRYGVPCVYDFRAADVAAGGQGAPLAPIYHKALVERTGLSGCIAVLNLGGVGNVTIVGQGVLAATDTGPANGPLDSWLERHGQLQDYNGDISRAGHIDFDRVAKWLQRPFFYRPLPRSADRYDFDVLSDMAGMSLADGAATLCAFTVLSVKASFERIDRTPDKVIVCGGGRHNRTLMTMLGIELGCPVMSADSVGWNADMIEAQAFGFMAVRTLRGLPISFPDTTGAPRPMCGGRVVYPSQKSN